MDNFPNVIHFVKADLPESAAEPTGHKVQLDETGQIVLSEKQRVAYEQFSKSGADFLLKNLSPLDVFYLYTYAGIQKDYLTQYNLFNNDPNVEKIFKTYEEFAAASSDPSDDEAQKNRLEVIKSANLVEVIVDGDRAYIEISKQQGIGFGLSKNHNGFWMVNWLPYQ